MKCTTTSATGGAQQRVQAPRWTVPLNAVVVLALVALPAAAGAAVVTTEKVGGCGSLRVVQSVAPR